MSGSLRYASLFTLRCNGLTIHRYAILRLAALTRRFSFPSLYQGTVSFLHKCFAALFPRSHFLFASLLIYLRSVFKSLLIFAILFFFYLAFPQRCGSKVGTGFMATFNSFKIYLLLLLSRYPDWSRLGLTDCVRVCVCFFSHFLFVCFVYT